MHSECQMRTTHDQELRVSNRQRGLMVACESSGYLASPRGRRKKGEGRGEKRARGRSSLSSQSPIARLSPLPSPSPFNACRLDSAIEWMPYSHAVDGA